MEIHLEGIKNAPPFSCSFMTLETKWKRGKKRLKETGRRERREMKKWEGGNERIKEMINVNGKQTSRVREANKTRQAFLRTKIGQQVTELKRAELELCSRGFQRGKNGIKKYLDNIVVSRN